MQSESQSKKGVKAMFENKVVEAFQKSMKDLKPHSETGEK